MTKWIKYIIITFVFMASLFLLLCLGSAGFMSPSEMANSWNDNYYTNTTKIICICVLLVCFSTAFSSTTLQSINRNNIASSSTLGIGASGTLGYLFSIWFKIHDYGLVFLIIFLVGIIPLMINFLLVTFIKINVSIKSILVGLSISAIIGVVVYMVRDRLGVGQSSLMFISNLGGQVSWVKFYWAIGPMLLGLLIVVVMNKKINIISSSQYLAEKHVQSIKTVNFISAFGVLLFISASTFLMGSIAFLGILGPNLAKMFFKTNNNLRIALIATIFSLVIVLISRVLYAYWLIEPGLSIVLMAMPIFLYVIVRRKNE